MFDQDRVSELLALDESDLYFQLGISLASTQAFPLPRRDVIARGKRWISTQRRELAALVCPNKTIKAVGMRSLKAHERVILACEVAEIIAHKLVGTEPVLVAVLLVREGLYQLCGEIWDAAE